MSGVLVHEWIAPAGGSENVLQAMTEVFPDADVLCLWNDSGERFAHRPVRETWLARTPLRRTKAGSLALMPATWRSVRGEYDWALISSHAFAHHVNFGRPAMPRFVYVHTPARYIWNPDLDARGRSLPARVGAPLLRGLDRRRAQEGASFAANSDYIRRRVALAWGVDARVIHPPVDVEAIQSTQWSEVLDDDDRTVLDAIPAPFLLGASRFVPYKRLDLVIRAGEAVGVPVVLAGHGPDAGRLAIAAANARVPVHIITSPSTPLLRALYERTLAFVFPALEDFGIMPVEAMAAGAPVISLSTGGSAETVVPGRTGSWADFDSDADLRRALAEAIATDPAVRRAHAKSFSRSTFTGAIREWVAA